MVLYATLSVGIPVAGGEHRETLPELIERQRIPSPGVGGSHGEKMQKCVILRLRSTECHSRPADRA